jgi:hypothetical protein
MKGKKPLVAMNLAWLIQQETGLNPNLLSLRIEKKVPQATIHRILDGQHKAPRTTTLAPLAEYFGVKVSDLLEWDFHARGRPPANRFELREDQRGYTGDLEVPQVLRVMWKDWPGLDPDEQEVILKAIADARALFAKVRGGSRKKAAAGLEQKSGSKT